MGFRFSLFLSLASLSAIWAQQVEDAVIVVNGTQAVTNTDPNYICATIDWWPHDKCNYNQCPWGYSSIINMDLSHPFLAKAIQAFERLRIRVGGSLQDQVLYDVGNLKTQCHPFRKMDGGLFGFSKGCLHMDRWNEVNHFFNKTGVLVTFGLNALHGRHKISKEVWGGDWDSSNANDFIKYTISKGHQIDSWEFGNELNGGVGAIVGAEQYGRDLIKLKTIIDESYKNFKPKPLLVAPGGFYEKQWYNRLLQVTGSPVINAMTHHIYNLGSDIVNEEPRVFTCGADPNLVNKILNPHYLSKVSETFSGLKQTIQTHGPWSSAWVGESGGAFNSGGHNVSNTFVNSFCALLWHRLMGKEVLAVNTSASPYLRSYAHCSKGRGGITLLLINLSNQTKFNLSVRNSMNITVHVKETADKSGKSFTQSLKRTVSWVGSKASDGTSFREEYHLTPKGGNLRSKTMVLNGVPLQLTASGDIPSLNPVLVHLNSPMFVAPLSVKFVVFPNFDASGCK
ncbi:hypothetical protein HYC85_030132 [Camellia sinensis]|uniref:Heparanase-like protein 2 n=1 Tax=Camellia sinensis TaxID=4442 RepID=A0A7J7G1A1_CAMSI|nr:hypothetical protein HYC85_030132 [Camellia sinensis]